MNEHKEVSHALFHVYPFPLEDGKNGYAASCFNLIFYDFETMEDALIWVATILANRLQKGKEDE